MLNLSESAIVKAGGRIVKDRSQKKKKKKKKSFCKTYVTPPDVIKYYNNPNYCLNCRKKIMANNKVTYTEMKSQIFCSKKCDNKYLKQTTNLKPSEKYLKYIATKIINLTFDGDYTLIDWWIKEFQKEINNFINAIENEK